MGLFGKSAEELCKLGENLAEAGKYDDSLVQFDKAIKADQKIADA
jgi:hypothetical protein